MDVRRRTQMGGIKKTSSGEGDEGPISIDDYLTIEALEDGLTASLSTNTCEYCIDGDGNWKTLTADTSTESINSGHTLSFRGNLNPVSYKGIGTFTVSKKCNLKGNCMSMLFGDNAVDNYSLSGKDYAFYNLFYNCANIVNVSENFLPATTLASNCYSYMFSGCTSLTAAPELPATTLADYCYNSMFSGCTSLTTAPELPATTLTGNCYSYMFRGCTRLTTALELPATTLANYCYRDMFSGCTSLTAAPELPATTLADYCYRYMFSGCTSLTTAPALPATTLANNCYYYMFNGCTRLTTAPELPATTLANYCYRNMFYNCKNLNYIKMLATNISATSCLSNWVNGVAPSGTFVKHPNMTTLPTGTSGIPYSWRVLNSVTTPENQLKSFTIRETSTNTVWGPYKFEEGMTIDDFYESECNLDGDIITITGGYGVSFNGGNYNIFSLDEILQEQEYTFNYKTTGGEPM